MHGGNASRLSQYQNHIRLKSVSTQYFSVGHRLPAELSASPTPGPENLSFPVDRPVLESPKFISENRSVMQQDEKNSKIPEQGKTKAQVSKT